MKVCSNNYSYYLESSSYIDVVLYINTVNQRLSSKKYGEINGTNLNIIEKYEICVWKWCKYYKLLRLYIIRFMSESKELD